MAFALVLFAFEIFWPLHISQITVRKQKIKLNETEH